MRPILRIIALLLLASQAMAASAADFFPPEYKRFPFKEGDLLASQGSNGKFSVNKILKIDRVVVRKGQSINIQGRKFTAPVDDYLLVVSSAYGEFEFQSMEQARAAARSGTWKIQLAHVPNRPPGAAGNQVLIGSAPVTQAELGGYRLWRKSFDKGEAGVF